MTKDQALKMALEALEAEKNNYLYNPKLSNAITAIKQALEQPEQELVATVKSWTNGSHWRNYELEWYKDVPEGTKLFTNPAPAQPEPFKPITEDMVTDEMIDLVETTTTGAGAWDMVKPKELIAAAVNAFNGVKP